MMFANRVVWLTAIIVIGTFSAPMAAPPSLQKEMIRKAADRGMKSLMMPITFDCKKAASGVDYVVCADARLIEAESRLEEAYRDALAAMGDGIKKEQREWSRFDHLTACRRR
jgi:uncharacterized protein YecT (DUF1311 family)